MTKLPDTVFSINVVKIDVNCFFLFLFFFFFMLFFSFTNLSWGGGKLWSKIGDECDSVSDGEESIFARWRTNLWWEKNKQTMNCQKCCVVIQMLNIKMISFLFCFLHCSEKDWHIAESICGVSLYYRWLKGGGQYSCGEKLLYRNKEQLQTHSRCLKR